MDKRSSKQRMITSNNNVIHIEQKKKQMTVMVVDKEVTINTRSKKPNMK